jgi:hypothetical protein
MYADGEAEGYFFPKERSMGDPRDQGKLSIKDPQDPSMPVSFNQ